MPVAIGTTNHEKGLVSPSSHGNGRGLDSGLRRNDGVGVALGSELGVPRMSRPAYGYCAVMAGAEVRAAGGRESSRALRANRG